MVFINWLVDTFGYAGTVHLKDFILGVACALLGIGATALIMGKFFYRLDRVDHLRKMTVVKMVHEGELHYLHNPSNYWEAVEAIIHLAVMAVFRKKKYTLADKKRTKRFIFLFCILLAICLVLSVFFISAIIAPDYINK